ncbi:MAG: hypothetical protein U0984_05980 [Prosthecobacter sp.]|nr:hypothetical protein [Prosthecobacter sp.]
MLYLLAAAAIATGLSSCSGLYFESGDPSPIRISGAYAATYPGPDADIHQQNNWHDDEGYYDEVDQSDRGYGYRFTRYVPDDRRYEAYPPPY